MCPTCQCYQHSPAPPPRPPCALALLLFAASTLHPLALFPLQGAAAYSCPLPTSALPAHPLAAPQASLDAALKEVDAKFGKLDVLICAAGILGEMQLPQNITEDNW